MVLVSAVCGDSERSVQCLWLVRAVFSASEHSVYSPSERSV